MAVIASDAAQRRQVRRFGYRSGTRRRTSWLRLDALSIAAVCVTTVVLVGREGAAADVQAVEPSASALAGTPTRITDGDTFRLGEVRVRLHGVDAPELRTDAGPPARRHLRDLIGAGAVRCDDTGERSYERVVAVCWTAGGRELNAAMVQDGWAVDAPRFSRGRYATQEAAARQARRGMHAA